MKKIISLALAAIIAFSCMSVGVFAVTTTAEPKVYVCPYSRKQLVQDESGKFVYAEVPCGETFTSEKEYNEHVASCKYYVPNMVSPSLNDAVAAAIKIADSANKILEKLVPIINKLIDAIFKALKNATAADGVAGAVEDLEAELTLAGIDTQSGEMKGLLDTLKAKIKALYCGEPATTAEAIVNTGSSASTGIAVFAAVAVAAAAAYVCTRKKDEE